MWTFYVDYVNQNKGSSYIRNIVSTSTHYVYDCSVLTMHWYLVFGTPN